MTGSGEQAVPGRNEPVTGPSERAVACATLTYLAEPGDVTLGALLGVIGPAEVLQRIRSGTPGAIAASQTALGRWRNRLARVPADAGLPAAQRKGIRLICPGDPEWPPQLDDLGAHRPYALWARGNDLRAACGQAVAVVGSRAATAYGTHVATGISADLAGNGWAVISGAAYGIDAAAHHGALLADGYTVAVLACGADIAYPRGHADLLATIATCGTIVSEYPPGQVVSRIRFLARNRIIAALSVGTVIAEAGLRSGALATARYARNLGRPVMAVPGPVTSAQSAGCHQLIRDHAAACVTDAADILTHLTDVTASNADNPSAAHQQSLPAGRWPPQGVSPSPAVTPAAVRVAARYLAAATAPASGGEDAGCSSPGVHQVPAGPPRAAKTCGCSLIPAWPACAAASVPATRLSLRSPTGGHRSFPEPRPHPFRDRLRRCCLYWPLGNILAARAARLPGPVVRVAGT